MNNFNHRYQSYNEIFIDVDRKFGFFNIRYIIAMFRGRRNFSNTMMLYRSNSKINCFQETHNDPFSERINDCVIYAKSNDHKILGFLIPDHIDSISVNDKLKYNFSEDMYVSDYITNGYIPIGNHIIYDELLTKDVNYIKYFFKIIDEMSYLKED